MLPVVSEFAAALRSARKAAGLSQRELGRALGDHGGKPVTGALVSLWEAGAHKPSHPDAVALEKVLNQRGIFTSLLGYAVERDVLDRLDRIEAQVEELTRLVDRLLGDEPLR